MATICPKRSSSPFQRYARKSFKILQLARRQFRAGLSWHFDPLVRGGRVLPSTTRSANFGARNGARHHLIPAIDVAQTFRTPCARQHNDQSTNAPFHAGNELITTNIRIFLAPFFFPALVFAGANSRSAVIFWDNYSNYPTCQCFSDGQVIGPWISTYGGYGCTDFVSNAQGYFVSETPKASTSPNQTHASLFNGPVIKGNAVYQISMMTVRQLRVGSAPNPWEVAWFLWNYTDDTHFYSINLKPNGWELGKEDPAYPGAQRYLATGSTPTFPIGKWYNVKVVQIANLIEVHVNGNLIASVTDTERPYTTGRIGLYNEDCSVLFGPILVTLP